ncbi:MAG: glycoside hydrolase family 5 protein [Lachnospiraceae bacterium]|nr:glycoside hydrolase family 5 protein [Lachnospiraceae bacterium]
MKRKTNEKRRMQKLGSLLLAGVLCVGSLTACGGPSGPATSTGDETTATQEVKTTEAATTGSDTQSTTESPTAAPTQAPTAAPTQAPTAAPTQAPTTEAATDPVTQPGEIISLEAFPEVNIPDTEAIRFVENLQIGWNLGNTFDAHTGATGLNLETAWVGVKTTQKLIRTVYDAGFRTIRIPVSWHGHVDAETMKIDEAWLNRVKEVVDWSLDAGLYVIINIHHDNDKNDKGLYLYPSYDELETSKKYVTAIWSQVAEAFADYDERLVFETMNEPRQVGTSYEWWVAAASTEGKECIDCVNQLNQTIVDTIRAQGSEANRSRYIMCPGYCASPDFATPASFALPTDDQATKENRILLSVHAYRPYYFALAGTNESQYTEKFTINKAADRKDIDSFLKAIYAKYVSKGVGVVIGEFGARLKNNNDRAREEFAAYYVAAARNYGMTAIWWDNHIFSGSGEIFGLIRRSDCSIVYQTIVDQLIYYSTKEHLPAVPAQAS